MLMPSVAQWTTRQQQKNRHKATQKVRENMTRANENTLMIEWYVNNYPTDDLGCEMNDNVTFRDLFDALDRYQDIYDVIGLGDSVIRERLFTELARIMECDYDYIYSQWLLCA